MEGDGGYLEQQAGDGRDQRNDGHWLILRVEDAVHQFLMNHREVRASRQAVEQRESVGEDAGGERAEQQVFQRGFVGAAVAAQESYENVGGDGHQF